MTINEEQQLGRTKNAILAFLERRISIPKIYIDAIWDGHQVDVLAIDRDGVGDVHAAMDCSISCMRVNQSPHSWAVSRQYLRSTSTSR
jgi:hypothetical protein